MRKKLEEIVPTYLHGHVLEYLRCRLHHRRNRVSTTVEELRCLVPKTQHDQVRKLCYTTQPTIPPSTTEKQQIVKNKSHIITT